MSPKSNGSGSTRQHEIKGSDLSTIGHGNDAKGGKRSQNSLSVRRDWKDPSRSHTDLLERLFVEGAALPSFDDRLATPTLQATVLKLYEHVETLKRLLRDPNESIDRTWSFFASHLGPEVWSQDDILISRPTAFEVIAGTLLRKLKVARRESQVAVDLPTASEIMATYASLGILHPADWNLLVFDLLHKLSQQIQITTRLDTSTDATKNSQASQHVTRLTEDLLTAWKILGENFSRASLATRSGSQRDWSFLPTDIPKDVIQSTVEDGLENGFLFLFPRYPIQHAKSMTYAALTTFALLTRNSTSKSLHELRNNLFMSMISQLLRAAKRSSLLLYMKDVSKPQVASTAVQDIDIDWLAVLQEAEKYPRPLTAGSTNPEYSAFRPLNVNFSLLHHKLGRALARRDTTEIEQLWQKAKKFNQATRIGSGHSVAEASSIMSESSLESEALIDRRGQPQDLYNHFILAYMGLRKPNRAIEVWNQMVEDSIQPNLSTWTAMLEGCKIARSLTSLEGVWSKLKASGVQPNTACWTARVSGLMECGKPHLGIQTLDEMGRIWSEAAKKEGIKDLHSAGDIAGTAKPSIEVINAAISGLLQRRRGNEAYKVLAWGGDLGIQPNIITFNTLMRALIREGRIAAVKPLLEQMQRQGVQADVATFTTILDEIFKTSSPQTADKQIELINKIFAEMEAAGVQANLHTYGKIIHSLLHTHTKDLKAVKAVMARMAARGLEPSVYIYTILVEHHFAQEVPDLEAVRYIIERIRLSGAVMDHIFWNRVIEGYAGVGDTANALTILGRVDNEGFRVGWPALQVVVRALVHNKEWDLAKQVVRNVRLDRGPPPKPNEKGVEGQHKFWRTVAELGLMGA